MTASPVDFDSATTVRRPVRAGHDTVAGCTARADADLLHAATMDTANGRMRFEHSASTWYARATLLQRLSDKFDARTSEVKASAIAVGLQ